MRARFDHFGPDERYEALVASLVGPETVWLDVGCGRDLFPYNRLLAQQLADRCGKLVGIDPDVTLEENPFVHERVRLPMDEYDGGGQFDLVTMRMVAEHVQHPEALVRAVGKALRPGGAAVVYTVNRYSPMPLLTTVAPMKLRHVVKRWLWGTEEKDTFPTQFRMNTRGRLQRQFEAEGFEEAAFDHLDDCRTFSRFRVMQWMELASMRALRAVGLRYPENCLLGVYRKK